MLKNIKKSQLWPAVIALYSHVESRGQCAPWLTELTSRSSENGERTICCFRSEKSEENSECVFRGQTEHTINLLVFVYELSSDASLTASRDRLVCFDFDFACSLPVFVCLTAACNCVTVYCVLFNGRVLLPPCLSCTWVYTHMHTHTPALSGLSEQAEGLWIHHLQ